MNTKKLKAGVIGVFGHSVYATELLNHPSVEPVGISDHPIKEFSTEKECKKIAEKYKIPYFKNFEELLEKVKMDVCAVLCPWKEAPYIIKEVAKKKIHILSEKPIADNFEGAKIIAESVRKNNIKYSACFPLSKFFQPFRDTKWFIEDGKLGKPLVANFTYIATMGPLYIAEKPHYRNTKIPDYVLSGGEVAMFSGYGIVALQWLIGKRIKEVYSELGSYFYPTYKKMKMEDIGFIHLIFEDNVIGSMLLGRVPSKSEPTRVEVDLTGTLGNIKIRSLGNNVTVFEDYTYNKKLGADKGGIKKYTCDNLDSILIFIDDFVKSILENREPKINLQECLDTISVLDAIYKSAFTNKVEKVISI